MRRSPYIVSFCLAVVVGLCGSTLRAAAPATNAGQVQFNRDVRPILSDTCFKCHGFDKNKREADLRLDIPDEAFKLRKGVGGDDITPIVPGNLAKSDAWRRIVGAGADSDDLMPPADSHLVLTDKQKETIRKWIEQGAVYQPHWAFAPIKEPAIPEVKNKSWVKNGIDSFILARLESEGLSPSPEADKRSLIRRVTLDLIGLPPTPAEVDAFVNDTSPDAYEKVVDRLLASPHYGERMTLDWLDAARYGDTHGFNNDSLRSMWPWRDWVIAAFNSNKPYNTFITEQLAGDLLPNATRDQKIASAFNRNHVMNSEGGIIGEEYRMEYVLDRTTTACNVFMGLTAQCARCHDHKFDPITQKDFYQLTAFFNSLEEVGQISTTGDPEPLLKVPSKDQDQQLSAVKTEVAALEKTKQARIVLADQTRATWEPQLLAQHKQPVPTTQGLVVHLPLDETGTSITKIADASRPTTQPVVKDKAIPTTGPIDGALQFDGTTAIDLGNDTANFDRTDKFSIGAWVKPTGDEPETIIAKMDEPNGDKGYDLLIIKGKLQAHVIHSWPSDALAIDANSAITTNEWHHVFLTYDGSSKGPGLKMYVDGQPIAVTVTNGMLISESRASNVPLLIGKRSAGGVPFKGSIDDVRIYNRELTAAEVKQVPGVDLLGQMLALDPAKRTPAQQERIRGEYLTTVDADYQSAQTKLDAAKKHQTELNAAIPTVMVMKEMNPPRKTFILTRGQYDAPAAEVHPNTPSFLPPMPKGAPANRLGLAMWLTDPSHPLTSRVAVNRFWYQYFGTGLVKTMEDWGTQGEPPSHPELLDWLAIDFMKSGWDVKAMQKLIVTSATYRQAARYTPDLIERDPENRLLARGPHMRLPAEGVRDNALSLAGLLVDKLGGPSVMPYQPEGLWTDVVVGADYPGTKYTQGHGDDLYRRSMYTFWKRTAPPPALSAFDAPDRESCILRRSPSDTPLQALVLMNDPTFIEASRKLAERMMHEGGDSPDQRIAFLFQLATAHPPAADELKVLRDTFDHRLASYKAKPDSAGKLIAIGESKSDPKLDKTELAAYTTVASVVLNLDEVITK